MTGKPNFISRMKAICKLMFSFFSYRNKANAGLCVTEVATQIVKEFSKYHGPNWLCFIIGQEGNRHFGRDFGWSVDGLPKDLFLDVTVYGIRVRLFKIRKDT